MTVERTTQGQGQDSVSGMIQAILRENSVLSAVFSDVSQFASPGDKSISFPRNTNRFQVQKLTGAQKGDDQELIIDLDKLELSEEAHIQWVIKKFDQARSKQSILENAIENATGEHAIQLDEDIIKELIPNITNANITGGITQDNIVDTITAANQARIPRSNRRWVFGNAAYGELLKIDGFVDASKSNLDIVRVGQIGTLYGVPVFESDVMEPGQGLLTHRDALAFGFGSGPAVESESVIKYGTGSRRWVMDQLYGLKTLNGGKMAVRLVP